MQTILELRKPCVSSLSEMMFALQDAAQAHSLDLMIDFERMLRDFDCLWMIARARITLTRFPTKELRLQTWLRKPSAAVSIRDYAIFDGDEEIGSAVYSWTLVHATERKILNMKSIAPVANAPTREPERTGALKRILLPEAMPERALWTVREDEIDSNGHLNNVHYVRHAEALFPDCNCLEVIYDRECFAGETLHLQAQDGFVRGIKDSGEESFRARFWKE